MTRQLVLSLFPGADLLGRAFEEQGCSVVRGPEVMLGQDIRDWPLPPAGVFDGVIGGPPCQEFSKARQIGGHHSRHGDMIGEFWRVVTALKPRWAVMENVGGVIGHPAIPAEATFITLRDWDCGGLTSRERAFYLWPGELVLTPPRRAGKPAYAVLASSHKTGAKRADRGMHAGLSPEEAGRLQGWPEIAEVMIRESHKGRIFPNRWIVHCLGNGVPRAMGEWVAKSILDRAGDQREVA